MLNWLKWISFVLVILLGALFGAAYVVLNQSLPTLDGNITLPNLSEETQLQRDSLGQAIIHASTRDDAFYALGYAHGQDRFFQMDLQRRVAAGELTPWLGEKAQNVDKTNRFHQFRQHANRIYKNLPEQTQVSLRRYADGVNVALAEYTMPLPEYLITGFEMQEWVPQDSILVVFSMYLDLQRGQIAKDMALTRVAVNFGIAMSQFLTQSSQYQAALDGSLLNQTTTVPTLRLTQPDSHLSQPPVAALIPEPLDIGSNNWAVSGSLTPSGNAMLASDMHLGLRVPTTWYRTQLNYSNRGYDVSLTGVSLPGAPGIIVGTNNHIAWAFTNANFDNLDWVLLEDNTPTQKQTITISPSTSMTLETSEFGPVRTIDGKRYALSWVAYQQYAVNFFLWDLDIVHNTLSAFPILRKTRIPLQNGVIADAKGNIGFMPTGAITARPSPSELAIAQSQYSPLWSTPELDIPVTMNPPSGRIWTANNRVISVAQLSRFGDGGYALGARAQQIRDRLFDYDSFDESRFYAIQLDNEARFLMPWHQLLTRLLQRNSGAFATDLRHLKNWQACACAESVGYTLVRHFRSQVISSTFAPIRDVLDNEGVSFSPLLRQIEPAIWQLIKQQPSHWLPTQFTDWDTFLLAQYQGAKNKLQDTYGEDASMESLNWGEVNTLAVSHPFSAQIPLIGSLLNMPRHPGFGDTFMPAVQQPSFGASERLLVRPGQLDKAILTIPGGQSGHPFSPFYKAGFEQYVNQQLTPLLPGKPIHTIRMTPEITNDTSN